MKLLITSFPDSAGAALVEAAAALHHDPACPLEVHVLGLSSSVMVQRAEQRQLPWSSGSEEPRHLLKLCLTIGCTAVLAGYAGQHLAFRHTFTTFKQSGVRPVIPALQRITRLMDSPEDYLEDYALNFRPVSRPSKASPQIAVSVIADFGTVLGLRVRGPVTPQQRDLLAEEVRQVTGSYLLDAAFTLHYGLFRGKLQPVRVAFPHMPDFWLHPDLAAPLLRNLRQEAPTFPSGD